MGSTLWHSNVRATRAVHPIVRFRRGWSQEAASVHCSSRQCSGIAGPFGHGSCARKSLRENHGVQPKLASPRRVLDAGRILRVAKPADLQSEGGERPIS